MNYYDKSKYDILTSKDFENVENLDIGQLSVEFSHYLKWLSEKGRLNYRLVNEHCAGATAFLDIKHSGSPREYICLVSNDYLGFSQHPAIKQSVIDSVIKYGTGAGSSPLIGGYYAYHKELEDSLCTFFGKPSGSAITYTTGYTANSSPLQALLHKEDIAIVDMAVHASVYEGCILTNTKRFLHNNLEMLERVLKDCKDKYRNKMVIIDGVYSQDGDIAPVREILSLCKIYGAYLMVDDAHGIGVFGKNGRGVLEHLGVMQEVDIITGTMSKAFGNVGGFVVSNPEITKYLQYHSRQNAFSAAAPPTVSSVSKAIALIDEEPEWRERLKSNMDYFRNGLQGLQLNTGTSCSAIIPVKIGDPAKTAAVGQMLLELGIYANPIVYPAVSRKDGRIRMSVLATHNQEHLDSVLNAFEYINKKLEIALP